MRPVSRSTGWPVSAWARSSARLYAMGLDAGRDRRPLLRGVGAAASAVGTTPSHAIALIRGERGRSDAAAHVRHARGRGARPQLHVRIARSFAAAGLVVLRSGPLWWSGRRRAWPCRSSRRPRSARDELLVDGSLLDNLPVGTLADLGEGPIIAVDVRASLERTAGRSGARAERLPTLGETLMRVLTLGAAATTDAARRHADLVDHAAAGGRRPVKSPPAGRGA